MTTVRPFFTYSAAEFDPGQCAIVNLSGIFWGSLCTLTNFVLQKSWGQLRLWILEWRSMRGWSARAPRRRAKLGLLLLPQRGSPPCTKVRMSPRRQRPQAAQTQTRPSWSAWMQVQIWPICDFFTLPVVEIMSNLNLLLFFFFLGLCSGGGIW